MKHILPAISILILVTVVGAGAFYFGQKTIKNNNITPSNSSQTNTLNNQTTPILTQTPEKTNSITAGGVLVFTTYTLDLPSGWVSEKQVNQNMDNLILSKTEYKIVISQAAGGGGGCTYPGQAPQEMAQSFASFIEINNPNGYLFRRGPTQGSPGTWTVCEKKQGSFGFPTTFGNITLTVPTTVDATIMAEIDSILTSLSKY